MQSLEEIKELEKQARAHANALRDKREAMEREARDKELDALKPVAERAHNLLCQWNHTDGCSWGYEDGGDKWRGHAHSRWLEKIEQLTKKDGYRAAIPLEKIVAILDVVEQAKKIHPDFIFILTQLRG